MLEIERTQIVKVKRLRHHHLQFLAMRLHQISTRLGAHADPVNAGRGCNRAVGFYRNLKTPGMERDNQRFVQLQQRFAAAANDERFAFGRYRPFARDHSSQLGCGAVFAATRAIRAHKIRVAKFADRSLAITLQPAPQIATRKAAKHGGSTRVRAFALQRVEDFLDGIRHSEARE